MGGRSNALVTLAERWAHVEPVGGRANYVAGVMNSNVTHRVTLRYDAIYEASQTVEIMGGAKPGAQLRVLTVENQDQANVYSVLLCESQADYSGGK
jgi:SPP1 family predicted phage head-tail adaptor